MLENGQHAPPGRRGGQAPPTLRWEPLTVLGNMVGPVKRAFPSPWVLQPRCGAAGRKASGTAGPALAPAGSQLLGRHCTSWVCPSHSSHLLDTPAPSPGLHPPPSLTLSSALSDPNSQTAQELFPPAPQGSASALHIPVPQGGSPWGQPGARGSIWGRPLVRDAAGLP